MTDSTIHDESILELIKPDPHGRAVRRIAEILRTSNLGYELEKPYYDPTAEVDVITQDITITRKDMDSSLLRDNLVSVELETDLC